MSLQTELEAELNRAKQSDLFQILQGAADKHSLDLAYLLAIASRETGITNELGDFGHGVGVLQIDIRFHPIALTAKQTGSWKNDPAPLIDYGAGMLSHNVAWAKQTFPQYGRGDGSGWLKIGASAYNAGQGGATHGVRQGDSDKFTTGGNYGADVLTRRQVFASLLA